MYRVMMSYGVQALMSWVLMHLYEILNINVFLVKTHHLSKCCFFSLRHQVTQIM